MAEARNEAISWNEIRWHLSKVEKPSRYTGGEINVPKKDRTGTDVLFALGFPDVYEIGMSHLGSQILYFVLNERPDVLCDRVYAPWTDMEKLMRDTGIPLFGLETRLPLSSFDIVGFSLQYELTYTNVLNMLDLGGVPLRCKDRKEGYPLIIAGGPCAMAPEPIAPFIDVFVLGDGEEVVLEIADVYKAWKNSCESRDELLRDLSLVEGVYVPSLYDIGYKRDGTIKSIRPKERTRGVSGDEAPAKISRRIVKSLEAAPFPVRPLIPLMEPIHDRAMVEIMRGCTQGCRFCQAGTIYRPVRERSLETIDDLSRNLIDASGYEEVSLVSLSSADYSCIEELVTRLVKENPCGARVSLPSLRVDSFSIDLARTLSSGQKVGLTLAPEAGTQRMRDIINKKVTEEDLIDAATYAFSNGFSNIKLYFMIGLPGETDEDVLAIADLAKKIRQIGRNMKVRPNITVSASGFVPKPNTAFQWEPCISQEELVRRQRLLGNALRGPGLIYKYHDAKTTWLEAIFARGDRKLSEALEIAYRKGARFDAWPDMLQENLWKESFKESGLDPSFYAHRERGEDEVLPWDHLDSGVTKQFLLSERHKARRGITTPDCRRGPCVKCGVCEKFGVENVLAVKREV
ncbi:MAG TPA: TIGR03960 family B12-binding radical SAM protein [Bacillota bacterium]|nr:TIGR03960 family B12-binding radical SAM protein [Bacillota bacterium]